MELKLCPAESGLFCFKLVSGNLDACSSSFKGTVFLQFIPFLFLFVFLKAIMNSIQLVF